MLKKRGRPETLDAAKREELTELVKAGQSRHAAAVTLGVAPSTVSKRLRRDPAFAEAVQAAEEFSETDLLAIMRKHCEKSWQATRWLLEMKYPQRYCKRKGNQAMGPSVDEVFDAVVGVLAEEIADETLRERIEARLDTLAKHEFVAAPGAPPRPELAIVEVEVEDVDEPADVRASDRAEEVAVEVADEPEQSDASDEPSSDDTMLEPASAPLEATPIANVVNKSARASPPPRQSMRAQIDQEKRRRKLRDKERKKQLRMKLAAKRAKRRRRT